MMGDSLMKMRFRSVATIKYNAQFAKTQFYVGITHDSIFAFRQYRKTLILIMVFVIF